MTVQIFRIRWQPLQPRWHWSCRSHPGCCASARRLKYLIQSVRSHLRCMH